MSKDYYLILGIPSDATLDDIKDAYRRLAKEFHPDRYGDNPDPFLAIQEAYAVLSDPIRRQTHDLLSQKKSLNPRYGRGLRPGRPVEPLIPEQPGSWESAGSTRRFGGPEDLFGPALGRIRPTLPPRTLEPENQVVMVTLSPEQAFQGGQIQLTLTAEHACPSCSGRGQDGAYPCWRCCGKGKLTEVCPVLVGFPSGLSVSDHLQVRMRLDQYGMPRQYLTVHFRVSGGRWR